MDIINQKLARLNNPTSPQQKAKRSETKEARRKSTSISIRTCTYCKRRELPNPRPDQKLKRCTRCRSAQYCSRTCQRADWKRGHQQRCSVGAIMVGNNYLDSLSTEEMAMDQLIDAYRLRVEDEKLYCRRLRGRYATKHPDAQGNNDEILQNAFQDFRDFLDLAAAGLDNDEDDSVSSSSPSSSSHDNDTDTNSASSPTPSSSSSVSTTTKNKQSILPRWWNAEKRACCEQRALNQSDDQNTWSTLLRPAGKDDILDHYQDKSMPMKLRMLAERVYGSDVMGGQAH